LRFWFEDSAARGERRGGKCKKAEEEEIRFHDQPTSQGLSHSPVAEEG
jgi:hypothetical protein